ncbi:nucleolin [Echinococcus multilocularis]|uniref:Nucleolin n=1 Tax=Echinococcus multilocularis TaxID=6211 RepID=A0A087VXT4_ECHMU|nr:nucleolin [Echinococcus multilocularis]
MRGQFQPLVHEMASSAPASNDLVQLVRNRLTELNDRTLLVSHLPWSLQLKVLIRAFKTPINGRFPKKKFKGNRKYAFLEFPSSYHARKALQESSQLKFLGRAPKCELVSEKVLNGPFIDPQAFQLSDFHLNRLNVSCVPRDATEDEVERLFPGANSIEFPNSGPGKAQGFARVDYIAEKDALEAFNTRHGTLLHGVPLIVNYCIRRKAGKRVKNQVMNTNAEQGENTATSLSGSEIEKGKRPYPTDEENGDNKKEGKIRRIPTDGDVDRPVRNRRSKSVKAN